MVLRGFRRKRRKGKGGAELPPKDVPESFTLLRYVPPPKDQGGECAMCSAYAPVLALETWLAYSKGIRVDLCEEEVFFCSGGR
mgnify:CR=1 FL=1